MAQIRLMLQRLLAERFHLKLRRESKQLPVYNLVVAKRGLKRRVTRQPLRGYAEAPWSSLRRYCRCFWIVR